MAVNLFKILPWFVGVIFFIALFAVSFEIFGFVYVATHLDQVAHAVGNIGRQVSDGYNRGNS